MKPRFHTDPRTCPHFNENVCRTCDFDGYYANTYPECPWNERQAKGQDDA